jgi:2-polyprenyl-3-methyl-5-hydroxy-6-metoxy-1,4-benzoquinol methylase
MNHIKTVLSKLRKRLNKYYNYIIKTPKYKEFGKFWVQITETERVASRFNFFKEYCSGKTVLHFGCTDWPIFKPESNLHIKLSKHTKVLHGFDIDKEGIENLKKFVDEDYFTSYSEIPQIKYDICLIPETIEHVDNVKDFLVNISKINAKCFLITAPNCFSKEHINRNFYGEDVFVEVVHPDHNCWYSPFTLKNQIEKYSSLKVIKTYLLEGDKMVCCEAIKK